MFHTFTGNEPVRIAGFLHMAAIGAWRDIFLELFGAICWSGLLERTETLHVTLLGDARTLPVEHPKIQLHHLPQLEHFEFPTLERLRAHCLASDGYVYYLHGKGVSRDWITVNDWRRMMTHFNIIRHADCLKALQNHDICGVNWMEKPLPHFSGNFWWARADYIRTLVPVHSTKIPDDPSWNAPRHRCEAWPATGNPCRSLSLHDSGIDHYYSRYLPESYEK